MSRNVSAKAPSNIALIKYMGKSDAGLNLPENSSLSMTLNHLCTIAEISATGSSGSVRWSSSGLRKASPEFAHASVPMLTDAGQARVVRHVERVRSALPGIFERARLTLRRGFQSEGLEIRAANTFPPASGIASSASSFAAITLATAAACAEDPDAFRKSFAGEALKRDLARVSRQGSGSSCRSFEGPWVLWEDGDAAAVSTRMPAMAHFVILVSSEPKKVASSEAHRLVRTSPLWDGRVERALDRTRMLLSALSERDLASISRIAWTEAWEMHSLFHTCASPFSYWEPGTIAALQFLSGFIGSTESSPIVTLDAGPNVHVMVPREFQPEWRRRLSEAFGERVILEDGEGKGAELLFWHVTQ
jgi:diphosphomevalonate decarboxylase